MVVANSRFLGEQMKKRFLVVVATAALAFAGGTASSAAPTHAPLAVAKVCSVGYKHAVIGGVQKCLRRGQYCAHRYDSQYRRYGFRCIRRDSRGSYHLT
jgi:hypothetical protein